MRDGVWKCDTIWYHQLTVKTRMRVGGKVLSATSQEIWSTFWIPEGIWPCSDRVPRQVWCSTPPPVAAEFGTRNLLLFFTQFSLYYCSLESSVPGFCGLWLYEWSIKTNNICKRLKQLVLLRMDITSPDWHRMLSALRCCAGWPDIHRGRPCATASCLEPKAHLMKAVKWVSRSTQ